MAATLVVAEAEAEAAAAARLPPKKQPL